MVFNRRMQNVMALGGVALLAAISVWMFLALRPRAAMVSPSGPQTPVKKASDAPATMNVRPAATGATGPAPARPPVLAEKKNGPATDLFAATKAWVGQERTRADALAKESFSESIRMMADWDSSYLYLVMDVNPMPALPETAKLIVSSRRFAKLAEEMNAGDKKALREAVVTQLDADVAQWKKLYAAGDRLYDGNILMSVPGRDPSELMVPLTMRLHAELLLLAQAPSVDDLAVVSRYAEALDSDANYGVAGFVAQEALATLDEAAVPDQARGLLAEYRTWVASPDVQRLIAGRTVTMPSYRSDVRPNERTSSLGFRPTGDSRPPVRIKSPPFFPVRVRSDKSQGVYHDASGGALEASKRMVDVARQMAVAMKH
jgi:hypothetical protein